jgi:hypothetical protein
VVQNLGHLKVVNIVSFAKREANDSNPQTVDLGNNAVPLGGRDPKPLLS